MGFSVGGLQQFVQAAATTVAQLAGQAVSMLSLTTTGASQSSIAGSLVISGNAQVRGVTGAGSFLDLSANQAQLGASTGENIQINHATGVLQFSSLLGLGMDNTDSSGSPGNATINKPTGRSAIAAAAQTCVVTNSIVAAASRVMISPRSVDATAPLLRVTTAAGSFTVTSTNTGGTATNATANIVFDWFVIV